MLYNSLHVYFFFSGLVKKNDSEDEPTSNELSDGNLPRLDHLTGEFVYVDGKEDGEEMVDTGMFHLFFKDVFGLGNGKVFPDICGTKAIWLNIQEYIFRFFSIMEFKIMHSK